MSWIVLLKFSNVEYKKSTFCKVFVLLIFALGVLRDTTVGTDIQMSMNSHYYGLWRDPLSGNSHAGYGFLILTILLKVIDSYYFYYGAIFAMTMGMYFFSAKKMGINAAVFFAVFFASSTITTSYNIIRQILALSAAIMAYSYLIYDLDFCQWRKPQSSTLKKIAIYEAIILLLTYGFHISIFILTIVPLFHLKIIQKYLSKDTVLWILLILVVVVCTRYGSTVQSILLVIESHIDLGERADFWVEMIELYGDSISSSHGMGSTFIAGSIAILASRGRRNVLFYIGFVGFLLNQIGATGLGTVGRIFSNVSVFLIFYYAQIFGQLLKNYKLLFKENIGWIIILLFLFSWTNKFYHTTILNGSISPYATYLFQ